MSLGLAFIHALIDEDDRGTFRRLSERVFLEDEIETYNFVRDHITRFGSFPSVDTVIANGHELRPPNEPVAYYAGRIVDRAIFNAINDAQEPLMECMDSQDMAAAVANIRELLSSVTSFSNPTHYSSLLSASHSVLEQHDVARRTRGLLGITTGRETLDAETFGLMPGELLTIVSRPGMGKTWQLLFMARQAWRAGHRGLAVSMEMMSDAMVRRWIGLDTGINPKFIKSGELSMRGEQTMRRRVAEYENLPPFQFVSGNFASNVDAISAVVEETRPEIVYIDAGYLLRTTRRGKSSAMHEELSSVIKEVKAMLVAYAIPGVITMQFNRSAVVTGNISTRLDLKSMGGTDAIGQDSDIVLGLRNPPPPFAETRKIVENMKIRDGEAADFATKFEFYPMNFDEVPISEVIPDEDTSGGGDAGQNYENFAANML